MKRTFGQQFPGRHLELGQSRGRRFVLRDSSLPIVLQVKTALFTEPVFLGNDQGIAAVACLVRC